MVKLESIPGIVRILAPLCVCVGVHTCVFSFPPGWSHVADAPVPCYIKGQPSIHSPTLHHHLVFCTRPAHSRAFSLSSKPFGFFFSLFPQNSSFLLAKQEPSCSDLRYCDVLFYLYFLFCIATLLV